MIAMVRSFVLRRAARRKCSASSTEADGAFPLAGLVELNGRLYGTTAWGGAYSCGAYLSGCGTVFSVPLQGGTENVLLKFERNRWAITLRQR